MSNFSIIINRDSQTILGLFLLLRHYLVCYYNCEPLQVGQNPIHASLFSDGSRAPRRAPHVGGIQYGLN